VIDFFSLGLDQVAEYSYYDSDRYRITTPPPYAAENREALALYAGDMVDPTLRARLSAIRLPTLVVWGDSDGIADADYGRAYAAAIPGAAFELLPETGHLPQIESPRRLLQSVIARPVSADS
jgi:pimeloyl-ACP methyl ester carboxylesterase